MGTSVEFKNHNGVGDGLNETSDYGKNLKLLPPNDQIKELQTILRDK